MSKYLDLVNGKSTAQYTADALRKGGGRIEKGSGEGSKGGNVIGHTASGKAIYAHKHETPKHFVDAHKDFSEQDHKDAGQAHSELKNKATEKLAEHNIGAAEHSKQSATAVYHHHMATAHLQTHAALNTERHNPKKDMARTRQRGHAAAVNASEHHGTVFGHTADKDPLHAKIRAERAASGNDASNQWRTLKRSVDDTPDLVKGEPKPQTEMGLIYSDDIMSAYFGGDNA